MNYEYSEVLFKIPTIANKDELKLLITNRYEFTNLCVKK